jgi:L-aspartate oxidase
VAVDARGRSSVAGLWAAGEVACTGAHGANRLASNSLLEAVVFGARIAQDIGGMDLQAPSLPITSVSAATSAAETREVELRKIMSTDVGVIRDAEGLSHAIIEISGIEREASSPVLRNMAAAALLIATAAWRRRESRGAHYRSDYPQPDAAQARRSFLTLSDARAIAERAAALPATAI